MSCGVIRSSNFIDISVIITVPIDIVIRSSRRRRRSRRHIISMFLIQMLLVHKTCLGALHRALRAAVASGRVSLPGQCFRVQGVRFRSFGFWVWGLGFRV